MRRVICHGSHARSQVEIRKIFIMRKNLRIIFAAVGCVSCRDNAPFFGHATVKRRRFSYVIHKLPRAYGRDTPRALGPREGVGFLYSRSPVLGTVAGVIAQKKLKNRALDKKISLPEIKFGHASEVYSISARKRGSQHNNETTLDAANRVLARPE